MPSATENYVQAHMRRRREAILGGGKPSYPGVPDLPFPGATRELLLYLSTAYPPRCIATGESFEEHLRYAGASALVDRLLQSQAALENNEITHDDYGKPINPLDVPDAEHV